VVPGLLQEGCLYQQALQGERDFLENVGLSKAPTGFRRESDIVVGWGIFHPLPNPGTGIGIDTDTDKDTKTFSLFNAL